MKLKALVLGAVLSFAAVATAQSTITITPGSETYVEAGDRVWVRCEGQSNTNSHYCYCNGDTLVRVTTIGTTIDERNIGQYSHVNYCREDLERHPACK